MSTKVKGEAIKEGSIPLNALNYSQKVFIPHCDDTWEMNLTQSYQVFPTDEIWYEDGYIYGDPVICVGDKIIFIKCENIERNKEYQYVVNDIFTFYIKVENGDVKIKGNSDIVELLNGIVYVGIYPANLKTSSDWNAQENEHGYIKNKPFGEKYEKLEWSYDDNYGCLIAQSKTNKIFINGTEYTLLDYVEDPDPDTYITINDTIFGFSYSGAESIIVVSNSNSEHVDILTNNVFAYNIKTLDEKYLPNTLLKTTPQTLSDTDKNQALANLGIDPVVWKYMCNPCIIKTGEKVPEELIGEYSGDVGEYGGYYLKYHNLGMYKIQITSNRIDSEFGEGVSVILTPSSMSEAYLNINDVYISKDYGVYMGSVYIDENKNWCIS